MASLAPLGRLPFFIHFLETSGRFEALVTDCPPRYGSLYAQKKRDVGDARHAGGLQALHPYRRAALRRCATPPSDRGSRQSRRFGMKQRPDAAGWAAVSARAKPISQREMRLLTRRRKKGQ